MKKKPVQKSTVDYQTFTKKDTDLNTRRHFNIGNIWSNSAKCNKCNDIIRSKNKHDYVTCSCEAIAIDGGSWYIKVSGNQDDISLLTELYDDAIDELGNER